MNSLRHRRPPGCDARGATLLELMVMVAILAVIALGLAALYLSSKQAIGDGSTAAYLQRQGTQIQEELARLTQRATALEMDQYGASSSLCRPPSGATLPAGKSIIYQRTVGTTTNPTSPSSPEYRCIYEDSGQLWLCQVSGLTPPQTCLTSPAPQRLTAGALRAFAGRDIVVSQTCFRPQGLDPTTYPLSTCIPATAPSPLPCPGCPASVDVTFSLDVRRDSTNPSSSILGGPRPFAFNLTVRN